ncbi:MAG: flavodoxin family protein [Limnochordia bacterium]|nr:flavodoxin family protein [Limnochordia bacterium]
MKVCVVHGSPKKGNTYMATGIVMEELARQGSIEFSQFFLPQDMPHFCRGCFACIERGENKCPDVGYVQPILNSMREADGLIFTSPVYVLGETGAMKVLLDHFAYIYLAHRPMEEMFSKVALVISTAAGGGTGYAMGSMSRSLRFWGVPKVHKCGFALRAKEWEEMPDTKQDKYADTLRKQARKFYDSMARRRHARTPMFTRIVFTFLKGTISKYPDGNIDKEYWRQKGWLEGKNRPF